MATITIIQNGKSHVRCKLSETYAEKEFANDLKKVYANRNLLSLNKCKHEGKYEFTAKFFNGWESWEIKEILDLSDNNEYCRY